MSHGSLYVTTPSSIVIAIDAETGKEQWRHDPQARAGKRCYDAHRGASIWPAVDHERATTRTIFSGTCDGRLIALDAATGRPRREFGTAGAIDLRAGADAREGEAYSVTSAPAIFRDLVITGAMVPEGVPRGPAGDIRAFDVRTGREVWRFHTVPRPGEYGHETWPRDGWQRRTGANVWSSMTVDHERGLVFLPIGSASYDFYGGDRKGRNLFANSLVALDAATGTRRWHQQLVHHDIWDYDPPSPPILADIPRNGSIVPVVIQLTKTGLVFVFERVTGLPVFGLEERAVPRSEVPGEETSPTQPFPIAPAPLVRTQPVTKGELTQVTPQSREECERLFAKCHEWRPVHAAGADADAAVPGHDGRRHVVRWCRRSGIVAADRAHQRGRRDRADGAGARGEPAAVRARRQPRRLRPVLGQPAVALSGSTVGPAQRHRPADRPDRVAGAARQRPRARSAGDHGNGSLNLGGPIVTAGGLVFIGGATDSRIRAFDLEDRTGSLARGPASQRARGPGRLSRREEWTSVRGDCRGGRRQVLTDYFGCCRRLCLALAADFRRRPALAADRGSCDATASGRQRDWPSRGWAS